MAAGSSGTVITVPVSSHTGCHCPGISRPMPYSSGRSGWEKRIVSASGVAALPVTAVQKAVVCAGGTSGRQIVSPASMRRRSASVLGMGGQTAASPLS